MKQAQDGQERSCGIQLAGEPLAHYLARAGRLPALQGLAFAVQLLVAVESLHRRGLVHGGITPDDLFVSRCGRLVLPGPGAQASAQPDHRTDLLAAAVVSYELLTGAAPIASSRADRGWCGHPEAPPSVRAFRPELPLELDTVFQRALAREPGQRYQTAAELSDALQAAIPGPHRTPSSAAAGQLHADPPPAPAHPCVAPPVARPFPRAQIPARDGVVWHVGMAFAALAAVTVLAANLVGGARSPTPGVQTEVRHDSDIAPRQSTPAVVRVVDPPQSAPLPDTSVDVTPAPAVPMRTAPPPPDILAATPQHPHAATGPRHRAPSGADVHGPVGLRGSHGAAAPAGRVLPLDAARPSPPSPRAACSGLAIATELCTAFRCATAEFRQHPTCVRMHAEGAIARAQLAESRGGP